MGVTRIYESPRVTLPYTDQQWKRIESLGHAIDADLKRGDFLVRNLLGADPQTGAVAIGARARTGQTLQYQLRDKITAHADLVDLAKMNGAQLALKDIGMKASDLDKACAIALQNQYPNPRPLEKAAIRQLLQDAYEGVRPQI